ncbi:bifunctional diguanylate cyclase/phosphodiesterase [Halomonas sp. 328]|uniref:bifunctional diguanylate cyclase/phosphodiesterase n=1 Tax=Halomonas sp. 328 TaxID=2776704 RepID=UPI0018A6E9BE|nr:EAL domain-containing protein [Halomonas sp. 328]MBF8221397.1 EAL domain-containing protein [Halomonas sp. 328]
MTTSSSSPTDSGASRERNTALFGVPQLAILGLTLWILHLLAREHFLLFHTLVELSRVVILGGIFVLAWHTRHWTCQGLLRILGMAAVPIAGLELLHALTYRGMGIFPEDANLPTQLWIGFRYLEAAAFLLAAWWCDRRVNAGRVLAGFSAAGLVIGTLIFSGRFPDSFIEGQGLTDFKIISEYLIIAVFAASMLLLHRRRRRLDPGIFRLMLAALLCGILSSAAFTRYADVFDMANEVGHYFLLISGYLVYRAILVSGLVAPYRLLFRSLKRKEQQLETMVAERTHALRHTQALNQAFFEHSPAALCLTDTQGRLTLTNPAFEALLDHSHEEGDGRRPTQSLADAQATPFLTGALQCQRQRAPHFCRHELMIDGQPRRLETVHFPLLTPDGELAGSGTIASDVTEQWAARQRIEQLARFDELTRLPNRTHFAELARERLAASSSPALALIYLDLDHFKFINDSLGHEIGDQLLQHLARRLEALAGALGPLCRHGGDEFLMLIDQESAAQLPPFLASLLERIAAPLTLEGHELTTTASVGVARYPDDGESLTALLRHADMAMYAAKADGRNTWRCFSADLEAQAQERLALLGRLHGALANGELRLDYQPQWTLATRRLIGAEALLRWHHPELGEVSPARFIPLAEESGLIVTLGDWALEQACHQAAAWHAQGHADLVVAVNLSAVQFQRGDLCHSVARALEASGLPAACLELELTESLFLQDHEALHRTLEGLKALGVKLAIDDFGTGYSNLAYLKRFAVDKLKIDRSFIADMDTDPETHSIVQAITQMSHGLGLKVIAEGVEYEGQAERLARLACDEVQGFHFGRPMSPQALLALAERRPLADRVPAP